MKKKQEFTGFPGDCSPEQLETLAKFRKEVKAMDCLDPPYDDAYLLRFLRARKFDLPKTMIMWKNFIEWRKEKHVDNILSLKFPEMQQAKKYYPHGYFRTDKLGRPIFIERVGFLKFDNLTQIIPIEKLQLYFIQSYERLLHEIFPACSEVMGKNIAQTCYIIDLKDAGSKMMSSKLWEILRLASKIGQDYYPEVLGTMFIINTPMFFYGIWNIIKAFIDEKTKKKIHILGSKYYKELSEFISDDNLPDFLGGKVTAKDYGESFECEQGPWIDKKNKKEALIEINASTSPLKAVTVVKTEKISEKTERIVSNMNTSKEVEKTTQRLYSFDYNPDWQLPEINEERRGATQVVHIFKTKVSFVFSQKRT